MKKRKNINFDVNATECPSERVLAVLKEVYKKGYNNPSASYLEARITLELIEKARKQTALALGCDIEEIFFTSGASESNSLIQANVSLDVDERSHHSLKRTKTEGLCTEIKALPLVVSETGQLLMDEILRNPETKYFVDLTQAIGKVRINLHGMPNVIYASGSGHKFGGILGCGIVYIKKEYQTSIKPFIYGSQEKGLRGGTYNVPAIICFGEAIEEASQNIDKDNEKIYKIIDYIYNHLIKNYNLKIKTNNRVINITFKNLNSSTAVQLFDMYGFNISAGSACVSGQEEPSQAYLFSGYSYDEAMKTIRISLGKKNTMLEAKKFIQTFKKIVDNYDISC